ncbi:hypothetical protein PX52LOC_00359 [Limnoglobus roseus]|uniref:Uncharacterized protein n=1 Tax=Limnoglobus roseus TaxID=2598579 RepID=A0A5C1A6P4_9BACT|nr:hypothetical protein PX52LOC_00359 [Limnoglobus roseus]
MNQIQAIRAASKFVPEPHLIIAVDGIALDEVLDAAIPGSKLTGLVSSLLGWFHNDEDSVIPWQRILPEVGCTGYAPILICPDDLDYSCSVVMAEVVTETDVVRWDRLGFDETRKGVVGSCIRWEPAWGSYRFRRDDYERFLAAFSPTAT